METTQPPVQPFTSIAGVLNYGAYKTDDSRDHNLSAYVPMSIATAEAYYPNLTGIPHWMQNKLGACVGHAAGKAKQVAKFHESGAETITPYSARFLYAMAKCLDGNPNTQGTDPRIVAKIMQKYGVATEATVPNDTTLDHTTYTYGGNINHVPAAAIAEAASNGSKISNYAFADITEAGLKAAIQFAGEHSGGVFMLINIDKNWWTDIHGVGSWAAKDILPLRVPTDAATLGGHETMPYAYDYSFAHPTFWGFNSWSDQWGDNGNYFATIKDWLPYIEQILVFFDLPSDYTALGFTYTFNSMLKYGMSGSDVVALQHALKIDGEFPATTPLSGYFGAATQAAVNMFQTKYASEILTPAGLTAPTGIVGSNMLKKLNALFQPK